MGEIKERKTNDFNGIPDQWQEITEQEFADSIFFQYTPEEFEYRQIFYGDKVLSVHLWHYYDATGIAIASVNKKLMFFRFGCRHDMHEVNSVGFLHTYECRKCNHRETLDSSG